jgi:chemotaxis protein MotB
MTRTGFVLAAVLAMGVRGACAQDAPVPSRAEIARACGADVQKFCSDVMPGEGHMKACMKAHAMQLSSGCFDALLGAAAVVYTLDSDMLFPPGGWQLSAKGQEAIARLVHKLAPTQENKLYVSGFTDSTPIGPELAARGIASNQVLSQMRADAVMNFLISQGMKPGLVAAKGFGDAEPVATNDTEEGRAKNRRVELSLYPL